MLRFRGGEAISDWIGGARVRAIISSIEGRKRELSIMSPRAVSAFSRASALIICALTMAGCGTTPASPSLPLFGAFFPFWLLAMGVGVIGAIVLRVVFIRLGIDEILSWRLLVYGSVAAMIAFTLALTVYGR